MFPPNVAPSRSNRLRSMRHLLIVHDGECYAKQSCRPERGSGPSRSFRAIYKPAAFSATATLARPATARCQEYPDAGRARSALARTVREVGEQLRTIDR